MFFILLTKVLIFNFLTLFFFYSAGNIFTKLNNSIEKIIIKIIVGAVLLSFIALLLNFFVPLKFLYNTIILLIIILISSKFDLNRLNNKKILELVYLLLIIASFSTILIFLAKSNRPDSGLYHYPFISLLNQEKINLGIVNLHSRFGTISILQYLQAINNNLFFGDKGMLLPLAIIPSCIYIYFCHEILKTQQILKFKKNKFYFFFVLFSIIFFSYKMSRYGEFGNDYLPHYLVFLLVSFFVKYGNKIKFSSYLFFANFIFLNKIVFITTYLFSFLSYKKKIIDKNFIFSACFIFLWFFKSFLNTGCIVYPLKNTCSDKIVWSNYKELNDLTTAGEAWIKGWPDQKEILDYKKYLKNLSWIKTWSKKNGLKIFKIFIIYSVILFFISLYFLRKGNINSEKIDRDSSIKLKFLTFVIFLNISLWFFKFPAYRFGVSALAIMNIIIVYYFLLSKIQIGKQIINTAKKLVILCLCLTIGKNIIKFKNYNTNYNDFPWPKIYGFNKKNTLPKTDKIKIDHGHFYFAHDLCMYNKAPCTHEIKSEKISILRKLNYKIYIIK